MVTLEALLLSFIAAAGRETLDRVTAVSNVSTEIREEASTRTKLRLDRVYRKRFAWACAQLEARAAEL